MNYIKLYRQSIISITLKMESCCEVYMFKFHSIRNLLYRCIPPPSRLPLIPLASQFNVCAAVAVAVDAMNI